MANIEKFNSIPNDYKYKLLGEGTNGVCYLTKDNNVYKEYKKSGIYDDITKRIASLEYDGFTFPKKLVFLNDVFKGYIKDYASGTMVQNLDGSVKIIPLIEALERFEDNIMDISYEECLNLYDLNTRNLIYNEKDKTIIDIDTDVICPFDYPITNPYYENLKELSNNLENRFLKGEFNKKSLNDLKQECILEGFVRPSTFMKEAIKEINKEMAVNNIYDYEKGLKLIRK